MRPATDFRDPIASRSDQAARRGAAHRILLVAGLAVAGAAAALVLPVLPQTGDDAFAAASGGSTAPVPAGVSRAVTGYASALTAAADGTMPTTGALRKVAADDALDELRAQKLELDADEQHLVGRPTLSDARLARRGTDGGTPTARVRVCVDSSNVRVVDAAGVPAVRGTTGSQRAVNVYDLRFERGAWRVVRHTFPAATAC